MEHCSWSVVVTRYLLHEPNSSMAIGPAGPQGWCSGGGGASRAAKSLLGWKGQAVLLGIQLGALHLSARQTHHRRRSYCTRFKTDRSCLARSFSAGEPQAAASGGHPAAAPLWVLAGRA